MTFKDDIQVMSEQQTHMHTILFNYVPNLVSGKARPNVHLISYHTQRLLSNAGASPGGLKSIFMGIDPFSFD